MAQNRLKTLNGSDLQFHVYECMAFDFVTEQLPKPFIQDERQRILAAFRQNRYYAYYADFVEFLLSNGCRPGEACALRWKLTPQKKKPPLWTRRL